MNRDWDYDRFERTDREIGRFESPLGEALEMQAFPRRKKKRKNYSWVIALAVFVGLIAGFVVYAMSLPEETMFAGLQPTPLPGEEASESPQVAVAPSLVPAKTAPPRPVEQAVSQLPPISEGAAAKSVASADTTNPLMLEMRSVDAFWAAASLNINGLDTDDARTWILPLDVAHADIWQYTNALMLLPESEGAWLDPSGQVDGSVEAVPDEPGQYLFATNMTDNGVALHLRGKIDVNRHALISQIKNDAGKTIRLFESIQTGNGLFVQLLSAEGPYKGALFFQFMESGAVRCAYLDAKNYTPPPSLFTSPPSSWEALTANAKTLFLAEAPQWEESGSQQAQASAPTDPPITDTAEAGNTADEGEDDASAYDEEPVARAERNALVQ